MKSLKKMLAVISVILSVVLIINTTAVAFEGIKNINDNCETTNQNEQENSEELKYPEKKKQQSEEITTKAKEKLRMPEVAKNEEKKTEGKLIEKEKYYKTYQNSDGTFKTIYSQVPNYYKNSRGKEKEYNNSLVLNKKIIGENYYEAASSDIEVKLPTKIKDGKGITFEHNGVKVELKPIDGDYSKSTTLENAILYNNVYNGIDVQYTLHELGVKEDIILNKYVDKNSFSYELDSHGDKAVLEDGVINVYKNKDDKKPAYTISAPVMTDANGEFSEDVKLSLSEKDGKTIVTVTALKEWLSDPARAFPIKIDPNIHLGNNNIELYSFTTLNNGVYGARGYGYAGYLTAKDIGTGVGVGKTRMLLQLQADFSKMIPEEANVTNAKLNIYEYGDRNRGKTTFECHYIEQPWTTKINWNKMVSLQTKPSSENTGYTTKSYVGWHSFDIKAAVTNWLINGNSSQHGLMIKAQSDSNKGAAFFTEYSNNGHCGFNGSQVPNIEIEWKIDNPVPPNLTVNNMNINLRPINVAKRDGTLNFLGMFADGLTVPYSTVSYKLNDSSKGQNGYTRASASYKYPTTKPINNSLPQYAKKYGNNYVSNWQTSKVFTNFDVNTLYNYSANTTLNGVTGVTKSSQPFLIYKIKQYDNFTKIANYYGVNVFKLRTDNRAQDGLLIANNTIVVINPTRNANKPYNPASLSNSDKAKIDSLLMGRGLHCEFGFEPVNLNTGNFYMNQSDFKMDDLNGQFEVSRTYNSKGALHNSLFGRGWSFDYDENLTKLENGNIVYSKGDGSSIEFTANSNGTYSCPEGYYLNLNKIRTGSDSYVVDDETIAYDIYEYEITDNDGTVKRFNRYGLLSKITDKKGFVTSLTYDSNYNLNSIVSPSGAKLVIGYASNGLIGSITLPNGSAIKYGYDSNNNLTSYTDANGNTTHYSYNSKHQMINWSDANGKVVNTNVYDSEGKVTKQIDANGKVTTFKYGDHKTTTTDANGNKTVYTYDSQYRTKKIDYADGTFETKSYDSKNNLASVTDCAGKTTKYEHDSKGNVKKEVRFDNKSKSFSYDNKNNLTKAIDFDGETTNFEYNGNGDLTKKVKADGIIESFEYDNQHRIIKQIDPKGNITKYTYNGAWVESKTDALGNKITYKYNPHGQIVSTVDANGNVIRFSYDKGGRKIQEQLPNGVVTKYNYDKAGNVTSIVDAKGFKFTFGYDGIGNMLWNCDALGNKTIFTYDGLNNKTSEIDALGNKITYTYDCKSNMTSKTDALSNKTSYKYDNVGNLIKITDAKGNSTENTYDLRFNKILTTKNSLNEIISYEYDVVGNLKKQTTPDDAETKFAYDNHNRLSKIEEPSGLITEYKYDKDSNVVSLKDNSGRNINYEYDKLNRNTLQTFADGTTIKYSYDKNSNVVSETNQLNQKTTYTYNNVNLKASETNNLKRTTKFEYDLNGNLIKETQPNGAVKSYEYNSFDLISKEIDNKGNYTLFVYDANENLVAKTDIFGKTEKYTYNSNNLLSSVTDKLGNKMTLSYDANGNNTKIVAPNKAAKIMEYDSENRLIKETNPNGLITTNTYGKNGQIKTLTTNTGKNDKFAYDKASRLTSYTNSLGQTEKYKYDVSGNILSYVGIDSNKTTNTYDIYGNLTSSTDAEDKKTTYTYDVLGNLLSKKDSLKRTWEYKYDSVNRLIKSKDPLNTVETYEYNLSNLITITTKAGVVQNTNSYDSLGNLIAETDSNGNKTTYKYDALSRVIQSTSADGAIDEFLYDANDNLIKHKNGENAITSYTYDSMGNMKTKTTPNGGVFTYEYDNIGNQTSLKDPLKNITTFKYDLESRLISRTLANGAKQTYAYDTLGRVTKHTNDTLSKSYVYDEKGNVKSETDGLKRTNKYTYDKMHRMLTATNAKGSKSVYTYDKSGNLTKEKSPLGFETSYSYDKLDRLTKKLDPVGQLEEYSYDVMGNIEQLKTNGGRTFKYTHDNNGNLTSTTNPLGQTIHLEYNSMNELVSETDLKGKKTNYTYNKVGNITSVTARNGGVTSFGYDSNSNLTSKNDAEKRKVEYSYDLNDRLTQVKEGKIITAKYGYDSVGNLTSYINGNENITKYTYDKLNNQTSITDPLGNVTKLEYNKNGLLKQITNPTKSTVKYDYNELDSLLSKSYDDKEEKEALYAYDADGNRVSMTDVQGKSGYEYDAIGRIIAVNLPNGKQKIKYEYDEYGNLSKLVYPDGTAVKYNYDELNRLTSIVDTNNKTTSYTYDENGNVTKVIRPNNTYSVITYDDMDNVTSVKNIRKKKICNKWKEETISDFNYEYDLTGLITKEIANQSGITKERNFIYDQRSQLVVVNEKTTINSIKKSYIRNITYTYDKAGNMTKESFDNGINSKYNVEYKYDNADRLINKTINLNGKKYKTDYKYDANGNLTSEIANYKFKMTCSVDVDSPDFDLNFDSDIDIKATKVKKSYNYDNENRLKAVKEGSRLLMAALYDGDGERIFTLNNKIADDYTKNHEGTALSCYAGLRSGKDKISYDTGMIKKEMLIPNGVNLINACQYELTGYINDVNREHTQVLMEFGGNSKITNKYTYGINRNSADIGGRDRYYIYDGRGSVSQLSTSSGKTIASYRYDIYGDSKTTNGIINNPYKYNAEYTDNATGLQYLRARYYDSSKHRFVSKDTYQGNVQEPLSRNGYAYVKNNPINYVDPSGHFGILTCIAVGAGVGGLVGGVTSYVKQKKSGKKVNWRKVAKHATIGAVAGGVFGGVSGYVGAGLVAKYGATVIGGTKLSLGAKIITGSVSTSFGGISSRFAGALTHNILYSRGKKKNPFRHAFNPREVGRDIFVGGFLGVGQPSIYRKTYPQHRKTNYLKALTKKLQRKIGCDSKTAHVKSGTTQELKDVVIENSDDVAKAGTKNAVEGTGKATSSQFKNQNLLDSHYDKHVIKQGEFGNMTKSEYLKGAQTLVNSPTNDVLTKVRQNGDTLFYRQSTNEFAIKTKDGIIRTYFKPSNGMNYYNGQ